MKKLKLVLIRILIIYFSIYLMLAPMSSCFARAYDSACGEYVSKYAVDFINQYGGNSSYDCSVIEPHWGGGSFGQGKFYACCSTGVKYMYELALGVNIYEYGFEPKCADGVDNMPSNSNWIAITSASELQPGDIVLNSHHTEMYIGNGQNANFGNSPNSGKVTTGPRYSNEFTLAFRLSSKIDVNPSGKVGAAKTGSNIDYSKFFFNGIPDGKYSLASSKNIFEIIVDLLANIVDYLIGIITYVVRIVFVGFTAIFDNLLTWTVNTVTDTGSSESELNISSTEIEKSSNKQRVTLETILFNELDFLNINIFE